MSAAVDVAMQRFFSPDTLAKQNLHVASIRSVFLGTDPVGYLGCCAALRVMNHADLLGQIKSPTLVISGERDVATPWTGHGEILARGRLRCCSFKTITWSSRSRRQLPTQRSATPLCHGLRNAVRIGWLPKPATAAITSGPNFASRSNKRNLCAGTYGHAFRNCWTIQRALGFRVMLKRRNFLRSWPITKKQYRKPNASVGTVKKSMAAIASRWFRRNVSQRLA